MAWFILHLMVNNSLSVSNVHCIIYSFDNRSVTDMNVYDGNSYIVFNFGISNNKSIREVFKGHDC